MWLGIIGLESVVLETEIWRSVSKYSQHVTTMVLVKVVRVKVYVYGCSYTIHGRVCDRDLNL